MYVGNPFRLQDLGCFAILKTTLTIVILVTALPSLGMAGAIIDALEIEPSEVQHSISAPLDSDETARWMQGQPTELEFLSIF